MISSFFCFKCAFRTADLNCGLREAKNRCFWLQRAPSEQQVSCQNGHCSLRTLFRFIILYLSHYLCRNTSTVHSPLLTLYKLVEKEHKEKPPYFIVLTSNQSVIQKILCRDSWKMIRFLTSVRRPTNTNNSIRLYLAMAR